jgi:hypothetical protein
MERDWPEGRGIFHNDAKTFLMWVNEEDQSRIISMEKGGDVKGVFARLARGIKAVGDAVKAESGKDYALSEQYGYIHSCPTNLGTGMRASVHVDLPGWTAESVDKLKARCEELAVQPRGTRGESGGQTGEWKILLHPNHKTKIFSPRPHLRHLQQAPPGLLRGAAGPGHDRRRQHPVEGGCGAPEEARNVMCHDVTLVRWKAI